MLARALSILLDVMPPPIFIAGFLILVLAAFTGLFLLIRRFIKRKRNNPS